MSHALFLGLTIVGSSVLVCAAVLLLFRALNRDGLGAGYTPDPTEQDAVFIFRDDTLIDMSDRARQLLGSIVADSDACRDDLELLLQHLEPRFADLRANLGRLVALGQIELQAHDDSGLILRASRKKGLTHLRLVDTRAEGALVALDRLSFEAMRQELDTLRDVATHMPVLSWRVNTAGDIIWANTAYVETYTAFDAGRNGLTWPIPNLFDGQAPDGHGRLSLDMGNQVSWFSHDMVADGGGAQHFATPIDLTVQTETSRREMIQILTRTFASLPTGLALFDTERRLQVFNPALVDLTGLDPLFLAARPGFEQVLFTLRELRMLPEPKDFATWRREITEMERAAESGIFSEEWCLENGRIYHVSGRPQPGGALAFFFEDVTSDATLARSLRQEIELGHAVLDGLPDAVVAFGPAGDTLISNARYSQLWGEDPCNNLADAGFAHALSLWKKTTATTPFWDKLSDFAANADPGTVMHGSVYLLDGTTLGVHARRLRQDWLMLTFRPLVQESARDIALTRRHVSALTVPDILHPAAATPRAQAAEIGLAPTRKARVVQHAGSRSRG
ncbi:MAG: PAS domain/PAS fold [Roseibaca calidilacus]|uniref:PAS domain-containing protein n=1 Tax=Roseibaca calidilacus TaxID=1666912 RepID=A0A0P7WVC6_9RHOB|nr:PAS-domain containing protein [Roseibaca calidilacus]KPP91558.1 MAG: PAS domain/PAS fold [Roseibaca calidilacus]CUX82920.1 PAS domain-containing protein [Roseibaca calidilacus]